MIRTAHIHYSELGIGGTHKMIKAIWLACFIKPDYTGSSQHNKVVDNAFWKAG